jgi:DNA-binding response OmpR family regulator
MSDQKKARILIVDDDPELVFRIRQVLEDEYEVLATCDWAELNSIVFRQGVDLVLMDVNLPVLKGDKLVQILRSVTTSGPKRPKILYFSAEDEATMQGLVTRTGADGYLSKSLRAPELLIGISSALRK